MRDDRLTLIHIPTENDERVASLGLVPRDDSSGDRRRLGAITKAGNARVRHVLVQAA